MVYFLYHLPEFLFPFSQLFDSTTSSSYVVFTTLPVVNTQKSGFLFMSLISTSIFYQLSSILSLSICPFKYDVLKPVICRVVNACQNVKGFYFPFSSFSVTDNDYCIIAVTIKMDVNCDSKSFLKSHSWLQFFILPISKTLIFCFLFILDYSSSKVNQKNLTTVIFSAMATSVSTSCPRICPDSFFITVNIFTMIFWSYRLCLNPSSPPVCYMQLYYTN